MVKYKNLGGDTGVSSFEYGVDFINVEFFDGSVYRYTYRIPGKSEVERMKELAIHGEGLNEYINRYIKRNYEAKLKSKVG